MHPNTIMLVGPPNVGKSMIFNYLTGMYATVSNYPGTTVDIACGKTIIDNIMYEVIDTPGMYSMLPLTEEEKVTRQLLCDGRPKIVLHVVDAKQIRRMLNMTLELLDANFPLILDINMMDEAEKIGIRIDSIRLSEALGTPVLLTSALSGNGMWQLKDTIRQYRHENLCRIGYDNQLEELIAAIGSFLNKTREYGISRRMMALLLLQNDSITHQKLRSEKHYPDMLALMQKKSPSRQELAYTIAQQRQETVGRILEPCLSIHRRQNAPQAAAVIDRWTREPLTGIPILLIVLYFGLYKFVGRFGAGLVVDYLNRTIFGEYIIPFLAARIYAWVPVEALQSLLIGEYGIFSLGLRYVAAIIFPVVGAFFLAFAVLEDSGYLPRLAMLLNSICKQFGLNGRAVIPLSLGFGCGTLAVMVTRTLETKRERILATFLLSLVIPCSAQLGVIMALLSYNPLMLAIWVLYLILVFSLAGCLGNKLMPGAANAFYLELPPIRMPQARNVLVKAYHRMVWYLYEIMPVFIGVSIALWLGEQLGLISAFAQKLEPILALLDLPSVLAQVFLLGFFRRDYGTAGLYDLCLSGVLSQKQLLVAAITLTLFVPCVAQFVVMIKERGMLVSLIMLILITILSLFSGWLINAVIHPAWL